MLQHLIASLASRFGYVIRRQRAAVKRTATGAGEGVPAELLMENIHGVDIYAGFDHTRYPNAPTGWGSESPAFADLIREIKPGLIIEVGTWKGASAIRMATLLRELGQGGKILCIDTWLGAIEFWEDQADEERFQQLACRHGYPQVYFHFLANVCYAGFQDTIIPFPFHSSGASVWLLRRRVEADMIYIDASHDHDDVYQDMSDYFSIVRRRGVLFGDDWDWVGVRSAVERFARDNQLKIEHLHDLWLIRKP
ncbi:hypothetical protein BH09VER1_BH09VER1_48440 [soil metagenome]